MGDEAAYNDLRDRMRVNLQYGHWSTFPCQCEPSCPQPSDEQLDALNARLQNDLAGVPRDTVDPPGDKGEEGVPGPRFPDHTEAADNFRACRTVEEFRQRYDLMGGDSAEEERKGFVVVPCKCGEPNCPGWWWASKTEAAREQEEAG